MPQLNHPNYGVKRLKPIHVRSFMAMLISFAPVLFNSANGQTPDAVNHSDTYAVSISMDKGMTYPPQSVSLVLKNISDKRINTDDCSTYPRVWVQGEHGEPPTTERERDATLRLQPGDHALACTLNMSWSLDPGELREKHILLNYLYDLHEPGKYSVYVELPVPEGWLRSNTTQFEVSESGQGQK